VISTRNASLASPETMPRDTARGFLVRADLPNAAEQPATHIEWV
jgi:hypothetical protein